MPPDEKLLSLSSTAFDVGVRGTESAKFALSRFSSDSLSTIGVFFLVGASAESAEEEEEEPHSLILGVIALCSSLLFSVSDSLNEALSWSKSSFDSLR